MVRIRSWDLNWPWKGNEWCGHERDEAAAEELVLLYGICAHATFREREKM